MAFTIEYLAKKIAQFTKVECFLTTNVEGLTLFRIDNVTSSMAGLYEPSVCLIAQGAKRVKLGQEEFVYDSKHYLFSGLHLPVITKVLEASPEVPYLGLKLTFDYFEISQLIVENQLPMDFQNKPLPGMATGNLTEQLTDAFARLVALLDMPKDIPILAPMIKKEIFYRLLNGEQGDKLRQLAAIGSDSHKIAKAISWLKANYKKQMKVEDLAEIANMSVSGFHSHFKSMTAASPIQFQKQLRLQEARRQIAFENMDVSSAAYNVGYESPSQFSREYSRQFGASPFKDVAKFKNPILN